jgi:hypothetical protein
MRKYYLLAIDKTKNSPFLVWWGPNDCGYTQNIERAGIYTEEQIKRDPNYYDNDECVPVPVEEIDKLKTARMAINDSENLIRLNALDKYMKYD